MARRTKAQVEEVKAEAQVIEVQEPVEVKEVAPIVCTTSKKGFAVYSINGKNFALVEYSKKSARVYIHGRLEYQPEDAVANRATSQYRWRKVLPYASKEYSELMDTLRTLARERLA